MATKTDTELAEHARRAIELVCSGSLSDVGQYYAPDFVDHVNALVYRGHDGARESVALYRRLFPDLRFEVDDQVSEGDRVATRWTLHGTNRGRHVRLSGITISRFAGGRIVEDWGATDTLELVRQLGLWRTALVAITEWRLLLRLSRGGRA